jgi:hypothetical protein
MINEFADAKSPVLAKKSKRGMAREPGYRMLPNSTPKAEHDRHPSVCASSFDPQYVLCIPQKKKSSKIKIWYHVEI